MARSIVPQHEQYGLLDKEATSLPPKSEVADLLKGRRTIPGYMKRAEGNRAES